MDFELGQQIFSGKMGPRHSGCLLTRWMRTQEDAFSCIQKLDGDHSLTNTTSLDSREGGDLLLSGTVRYCVTFEIHFVFFQEQWMSCSHSPFECHRCG